MIMGPLHLHRTRLATDDNCLPNAWALTPRFQPYRSDCSDLGGIFSVALFSKLTPCWFSPASRSMVPGLSFPAPFADRLRLNLLKANESTKGAGVILTT